MNAGSLERRWAVRCASSGRRYLARAQIPPTLAPGVARGLLIVLDGHAYFESAAQMLRAHGPARDVILATLDYPDDAVWTSEVLARHAPLFPHMAVLPPREAAAQLERFYDLTTPATQAVLDAESVPGLFAPPQKGVGGLDAYLDLISKALVEPLANDYAIVAPRRAMFGHSLGGMGVLHALFTRPSFAQTFIASSPAIWWNQRAVLETIERSAVQVAAGTSAARLLITVGAEEAHVPTLPARMGVDPARLAAAVATADIVGNAGALAAKLARLGGALEVAPCVAFEGLSHGLAAFASLARGIEFAFPTYRNTQRDD